VADSELSRADAPSLTIRGKEEYFAHQADLNAAIWIRGEAVKELSADSSL